MTKKDIRQAIAAFIDEQYPAQAEQMVLGEGNENNPPFMLIGEAPGAQEVLQGQPFVGKAGKNLDEFLKILGISREALYVTNVVKYRPTKAGKTGRPVNRTPGNGEIKAFLPYLLAEINQVRPNIIVTLGNTPLFALTGQKNIGQVHGTKMSITVDQQPYTLYPLYHPAAVIYNRELKDVYLQDVAGLKQWIKPPVFL